MKYPEITLKIIERVIDNLGGVNNIESFLEEEIELIIRPDILYSYKLERFDGPGSKLHIYRCSPEYDQKKKVFWNARRIKDHIYLHSSQGENKKGCREMYEKFKDEPVLNYCALKYFMRNQNLIPQEWKGKNILFLGTVFFFDKTGLASLYVPYLYWSERREVFDYELTDFFNTFLCSNMLDIDRIKDAKKKNNFVALYRPSYWPERPYWNESEMPW
jgi:hypothetical protein